MKQRRKDSMIGNMVGMGVGNLVGMGLIGASAQAANAIPAGTAKDIAGISVGLQSTALLGHNIGYVNRSLGINTKKSKKKGFSI